MKLVVTTNARRRRCYEGVRISISEVKEAFIMINDFFSIFNNIMVSIEISIELRRFVYIVIYLVFLGKVCYRRGTLLATAQHFLLMKIL